MLRKISTFVAIIIDIALIYLAVRGVDRILERYSNLGEQTLERGELRGTLGVLIIAFVLLEQLWRTGRIHARRRELRRRNPTARLFDGNSDIRFLNTLVAEQRFPESIKNSDMHSMTISATRYGLEFWSRRSNPLLVLSLRWDEIAHIETSTDPSWTFHLFPIRFHRTTGEVLRFYPSCNPESSLILGFPIPDPAREMVAVFEELRG